MKKVKNKEKMDSNKGYQKSIDIFLRLNAIYQYVKNAKVDIKNKEDIIKHLTTNDFKEVSIRTIERDINSLETIFGIKIGYDKKLRKIVIKEEQEFNNKLYESMFSLKFIYDVKNEQIKSSLNMIPFLHMEHKEGIHIYGDKILNILSCITQRVVTFIKYKSYSLGVMKTYALEPYFIIENKNRFYVLGKDTEKNSFRTLAFDRINTINPSEIVFPEPNYESIENLIKANYGIFIYDEAPVDIVLKVSKQQIFYFETLKMHHSQLIIDLEPNKYYEVRMKLIPNYEFEMQLLSMGAEIEVLEPESLRTSIANKAKALYGVYHS